MKVLPFIILFLTLSSCKTNGQNCDIPNDLIEEIKKAPGNKEFSKADFFRINNLLFDYEFKDTLKTLRECQVYKASIDKLFNSENEEKRVLAYRLIGTVKDSNFNEELLKRINSDEPSLLKTWSSTALMENRVSKASDDLFKLFSSYPKGLPVDILINIYIKYDTNAVKKTCWNFIDSEVKNEQIMSIQCLANYGQDNELQSKLNKFLDKWDDESKGWVISSMSLQKMENLKPILSEYTTIDHLKEVIIRALENSPTKSDNEYAEELKKE
jgi:hypothetical protein